MARDPNPPSEKPKGLPIARRTLLQGAIALGAVACAAPKQEEGAGAGPIVEPGPPLGFELTGVSVAQLVEGMRAGRWSARSITDAYLGRIRELNPKLHAVIEVNPDAQAIADGLDRERAGGKVRGPLHGIPVLLKDNIGTVDATSTTAGSLALVGGKPKQDAFIAARLRAAGAVLLGKANMSEWANFRSTHSSSGWSARGGQCRNPYVLDRSPCGSSSGSAAAVAADLCAIAVGTETDGSITCPASMCAVVGLKPTVGLVSRSGIVPISISQDTAGPIARTVADAAVLLGALAAVDPEDPAGASARGHVLADYTRFLDPDGLKGARIGVVREKLFGYSDAADKIANDAIERMRQAGAVIVDPANLPHLGDYDQAELDVLLYEFKDGLNRYLARLGPEAPIRNLAEAIAYNRAHADRELAYFGQELFEQAQAKGSLEDAAYREARARCVKMARTDGIDAVMEKYKLDALVAPTANPPWVIDLVNGDHSLGGASTPAAVAGYPSISVPAGFAFGLPVGLLFFGRAFSEGTLLKLAYAFEQHSGPRVGPRFLPTLELGNA